MFYSNVNVITLSLENTRRIRVGQTGNLDADLSSLDKYAGREHFTQHFGDEIMAMNVDEFFTAFETLGNIPRKRNNIQNIVLRVLQHYSPNPNNATFPLYCKFRLIQYKPWRDRLDENLFNHGDNEVGWVRAWKEFIESDLGKVLNF